jgi:hypothetical protein
LDPWLGVGAGTDYFLVQDGDDAMLGKTLKPTSQFLRRMVAEFLGCDAEWDYRQHPNPENAHSTVRLFAGAFTPSGT